MRATGWRDESAIAAATMPVLARKYMGAMIAAVRKSDAKPGTPQLIRKPTGTPTSHTASVSDAMLKSTRWGGLRTPTRSVHCPHALTVAMHVASAGPSARSAQQLTACASDRFEWPHPSGSSIFAADV